MAALLCEELGKRVSLPGDETNKAVQWTISHKDVMYINDLPFVKLDPRSYTLLNLVRARNKFMDDGVVSLAGNLGLQSMINTRNAACDGAEKKECSLFECSDVNLETPPTKKPRKSRTEIQSMRASNKTIDITISPSSGPVTIVVVKHVGIRDKLFVEFTPEAITAVITVLWESEWGEPCYYKRDPTLPKGVRFQHGKYVVMVDGKNRWCKDLETAQLALSGDE